MKASIQLPVILLSFILLFSSCTKDKEVEPAQLAMGNTNWSVTITVPGSVYEQNIFEFINNGHSFAWHFGGGNSYTGTWTQTGTTVTFTFKETVDNKEYYWDSSGTLSSDGATLTGTMQRRGTTGSATFTARKL